MEKTRLTIAVVSICLFFLLGSIPMYIFFREFYINNRVAIRKSFYGLILIFVSILWLYDSFPFTSVSELTIFVVSVVIIDLMIFQTPDITKFLSNELRHEQVAETINENRGGAYEDLLTKLNKMNELIEKNEEMFQTSISDFTVPINYVNFVNSYLEEFIQNSLAKFYIYYIEIEDSNYVEGIEKAYDKVNKKFDFSYSQLGMRKHILIQKLSEGLSVEVMPKRKSIFSEIKEIFKSEELSESAESYMLFVYSGEYHSLLFLLVSDQEFGATGANTPVIQNLLRSADTWIQKQNFKEEQREEVGVLETSDSSENE